MKEFRVNKYIVLRLEKSKTIIYVNGERFNQCKFLLLNITFENIKDLDEIESIDGAVEKIDRDEDDTFFFNREKISPETEFWAHCSNLQVWVENKYNTRLLHKSIAFPLLKKLTELGDSFAKIRLQEEIINRLESGYLPVAKFLIEEGYLNYLDKPCSNFHFLKSEEEREALDDLNNIAKNTNHDNFEMARYTDIDFFDEEDRGSRPGFYIVIQDKHIIGLDIHLNQLKEFPKAIFKLRYLKKLYLDYNNISVIPNEIIHLKYLIDFSMKHNKLSYLPRSIGKLEFLENLGLDNNDLKSIPDMFVKNCALQHIYLNFNLIDKIPESISKCKHLKQLHLENNN